MRESEIGQMRKEPADDTRREGLVTSVVVMVAFFALYSIMQEDRAFLTAILIGNVYVVARMKIYLRNRWWFWIFFVLVSTIHIVVFIILDVKRLHPPILIWPFAIADGVVIYYALDGLERRLLGDT